MKNDLIISGTKKDFESIMLRLIGEYGKNAKLIDVIKNEQIKYGERGTILN